MALMTRGSRSRSSARHVVLVVGLIEENVFPIARVAVGGVLLQDAVLGDAVLRAELLPKLGADLVAALANLQGDHLARHPSFGGICAVP